MRLFHFRHSSRAEAPGWGAAGVALLLAGGAAAVFGGGLAGCAASAAYSKCGLRGCVGDAAITAEVKTLFGRHPVLEAPNLLSVQTLDGVVYLGGIVDTDFERQIAASVATEAQGVVRVVNSIGLANGR
jgi:osmotically-inducible protein OsmY